MPAAHAGNSQGSGRRSSGMALKIDYTVYKKSGLGSAQRQSSFEASDNLLLHSLVFLKQRFNFEL